METNTYMTTPYGNILSIKNEGSTFHSVDMKHILEDSILETIEEPKSKIECSSTSGFLNDPDTKSVLTNLLNALQSSNPQKSSNIKPRSIQQQLKPVFSKNTLVKRTPVVVPTTMEIVSPDETIENLTLFEQAKELSLREKVDNVPLIPLRDDKSEDKESYSDLLQIEGAKEAWKAMSKDEWKTYFKNLKINRPQTYKDLLNPETRYIYEANLFLEEEKEFHMESKDVSALFVSYRPLATLGKIVEQVTRQTRKKGTLFQYWCYEQKGTTKETRGDGAHCHLLFILDKSTQLGEVKRFKRGLLSTFGKLVPDKTLTNVAINIKYIHKDDNDGLQKRLRYLNGEKTYKDEQNVLDQTNIWRQENKLLNLYQKEGMA